MHMSRAGQNGQLFVSAKTSTAIPSRCALVRDALVQASLDPAVRSIDFIPTARVGPTPVDLNAVVIARDDGRYLLDVLQARPLRDVENEGLALLALDQLGLPSWTLTEADIGASRGLPTRASSGATAWPRSASRCACGF
jgi:hypothetical protein